MQRANEPFSQDHDSTSDSDAEEPSSFILFRPRYLQSTRLSTPTASSAVPSSTSSSRTSTATASWRLTASPASRPAEATAVSPNPSAREDPQSSTVTTVTPFEPRASDPEQTTSRTSSVHITHHPLHTAQSSTALHIQSPHLPLIQRTITFGTLKRASMANRPTPSSSAAAAGRKSKLAVLPSYFRCTTFRYHFQPEGALPLDQPMNTPSSMEADHPKRRRPHVDNGRRRRTHLRRAASHSDSSASGEGDSSSGSESGNSSYENDSGTCTPKIDPRPLRYQLPSRWSTVDKTEKTELSEDDLQVHYTGKGKRTVLFHPQ